MLKLLSIVLMACMLVGCAGKTHKKNLLTLDEQYKSGQIDQTQYQTKYLAETIEYGNRSNFFYDLVMAKASAGGYS